MAAEPILIVDDTPVNLKLTRIILVNEGYEVMTAASAEEALDLLRTYHPHLVLADIQLPGIDGLEFTRRVKQDPALQDILVVALTAFAMKGDEQRAIEAGCDGYITKPIDTRTFGLRIREILGRRAGIVQPVPPSDDDTPSARESLDPVELLALRRKFLDEGHERSRQLLLDLDAAFNAVEAARVVHQWIGTGGLLGYPAISRLAREVESSLQERPLENAQVRESLVNLVLAFSTPREARDTPIPESILQSLAGKKIAVADFPGNERERLCAALDRAQAMPVFFSSADDPHSKEVRECELIAVHVRPEAANARWFDPAIMESTSSPVVYVGNRDDLLELDPRVQALAREFLMDGWGPEEALVRLSLAASTRPAQAEASRAKDAGIRGTVPGAVSILVADDDPTTVSLVSSAIRNFGMDCQTAVDGESAMQIIRETLPAAVVLDVDMPGMDGYEVLSAVRREQLPVRVILLTARQHETDVLRGFHLGADDYMVKPVSPLELITRIKRLLSR